MRNGELAQREDCFTFVADPARINLGKKYLLVTAYGDWVRKGPCRTLAIIIGCVVMYQMIQPSMPWESLLFPESRVDEHDTPNGVVTYTIQRRPTVVRIIHVFVQAWLGFSLVHFPNKDLFLRQIFAFDTLMIVCPVLVVFAMWMVMEVSKHPPTTGEFIYYTLSQISKVPSLIVMASMDSLKMKRWLKITFMLCIACLTAYEYVAVWLGFHQVPEMEDCAFGLKCATAVDLYSSGLTTAGLFCCKAAYCYYRKYPFAVVRPRYVVGDDDDAWDLTPPRTLGTIVSPFSLSASAKRAESTPPRGAMAPEGISIRAAVASAATSATLAALASSTVGDQAQLQLGQEAGLRKLVESVVTSVQTAVEADLAASSGGTIASYQVWDWDSVIGIAAHAAAEGARLHRDPLTPGQDQKGLRGIDVDHPAVGAFEEMKSFGLEEMKSCKLECATPDAHKNLQAAHDAEAELAEMKKQLEDVTNALADAQAERSALHGELAASNARSDLIQKTLASVKEERDALMNHVWLSNFPSTPSTRAAEIGFDLRAH